MVSVKRADRVSRAIAELQRAADVGRGRVPISEDDAQFSALALASQRVGFLVAAIERAIAQLREDSNDGQQQ